jgi:hypothetical protein
MILHPKDLMRMLTLGMSTGRRICDYATPKSKLRSSTIAKAFWAIRELARQFFITFASRKIEVNIVDG